MPNTVWYSISPYGTGDIKTGTPNISISGGVATISVAQTGNIGCGCCIEYNSLKAYIAPNRLGFDGGGTTEIKPRDKLEGATSSATGIVRAVELTSGSWADGNAAGYIYFESVSGTWQNNEQINRVLPSSSSNVATVDGTLQGNIGNGNTQFVVKTATGGTPSDQSSISLTSIHHEYASLNAYEAGFTDSNHINNTDLTASGADVIALSCYYYDHDDQTADTAAVTIDFGTTDSTHYLQVFTPTGGAESINNQRHDGKWNDGKARLVFNATILSISESYTRIEGLQIHVNNTSGTAYAIRSNVALSDILVNSCMIRGNGNYGENYGILLGSSSDGSSWKVINSVFYDQRSYGIRDHYSSGSTLEVYNCTLRGDNVGRGIQQSQATVTVKNCAVFNWEDDFYGTMTIDYCASDDGDGTNAVTPSDWSAVFVDYPNGNFHLKSTDTDLKDAGTDLSSEGFYDDMDGDLRSDPWSIGADEPVSSGQSASLSDSLGLSETLSALGNYKASLSDSMNLTGTREALGKYNRSLSDDINFSEISTPIGHFLRVISDTFNTTDTLSVLASLKASTSDTLNLTDSITVVASLKGSLSDTLTFTDNLSALLKALASLSDILTLTDSITYPSGQAASLSDTLSFSDTSAAKAALLATISDVFTLTDTSSALAKLKAALSDTFNFSDEITTKLIGNLIDTLTLTDSATNVGHFLTTLADTLTLTDSTSGIVHFKVSLSDTLTFSEQISALASYAAVIIDTLNLTDEIAEVSITITGRLTVTFTSRKPTMVFTSRKPTITLS